MKISVFTRGEQSHSYKYELAFRHGLERHGHKVNMRDWYDTPPVNLGIVWGVRNTQLIEHFNKTLADYIVLERGYIGDRIKWTSCGFNGLNGYADFCNKNSDDKRLHLVKEYLEPIKEQDGDYILIIGQVPNDASVRDIGFYKWLRETYETVKRSTNKKIYYRPHPLDPSPRSIEGLEVIKGDLHYAMAKAHYIVICNSNVGVDAILAGYRCIATDYGSMIQKVSDNLIFSMKWPTFYDRTQWIKDMSYTQWTIKEMESGETWEHLKEFYNF